MPDYAIIFFEGKMLDGLGKSKLRRYLFPLSCWVVSGVIFLCLGLAGCNQISPSATRVQSSASAIVSPTLLAATLRSTSTLTAPVFSPAVSAGTLPAWLTYAPPTITPATAVPPPLSGLTLPAEVQVVLLAGLDQNPPYVGRTMALTLLLYNPRLAKASLVTLPGDLYVYIPGYTMQRLNVAYSVGGLEMLFQTLQYNFGLRPAHWVFAHPGDFVQLIDDLGGLDVPVLSALPDQCGGITTGTLHMNGSVALCYIRYRQGLTDFDADQRQQLFLRLLFLRMVEGGNLVRLPSLYNDFQSTVMTDLTLTDLTKNIHLALELGDPQRISYFQVAFNEVTPWQIPGKAKASVLLPRLPAVQALLQQAIDAVMAPLPLTDRVSTLVFELTVSPTATPTEPVADTQPVAPTMVAAPTQTALLTSTQTPTLTLTPTITPTGPTNTPTVTLTLTPTP